MRMLLLTALLAPSLASAADASLPRTSAALAVDRVPQDFATIQEAIDQGTSPVIEVAPGEWAGGVVTRQVTIKGDQGAIITSGPRYSGVHVGFAMAGGASHGAVTGFTFDCSSDVLDVGVYASAQRMRSVASAVEVSDNRFSMCVQGVVDAGRKTDDCTPATVDGGAYWVVQDNVFDGFSTTADSGATGGGIGVYLFNTKGADVLDNTFTGRVHDTRQFTTSGVVTAGCWDCTIAQNDFHVTGGTGYWSAVSNLGYMQTGAAASRHLLLVDNDATLDSAPAADINFRSYDSFDTEWDHNRGVAFVDHTYCGDDKLDTFEQK